MDILEKIVEELPYPAYVLDNEGKVIVWNGKCEEVSGVKKGDVLGTVDFWKLYGKKVRTPAEDVLEGRERASKVIEVEGRRFLSFAFKINGVIVEICEDVTQLKELESTVDLFRKLVSHIKHFGIHTSREDLKRTFVRFTRDMVGTDACELYMKLEGNYVLLARNPPLQGDEIVGEMHPLAYYVRCGEVIEVSADEGDEGNRFTQEFGRTLLVPLISTHGIEGFAQIYTEKTEVDRESFHLWKTILSAIMRRLRVEEELREWIIWFDTVVETVNCGVVFVNHDTEVVYASEKFREITGLRCLTNKLSDVIEKGRLSFYRAMEQSMRGNGFCSVSINSREFYVRVRMISLPGKNPVFCCVFKHRKCEKELFRFYTGVVEDVAKCRSHRNLAASLCRRFEDIPGIEYAWFYSFRGKRGFYSPCKRLGKYLARYAESVACLKLIEDAGTDTEIASGTPLECPINPAGSLECPVRRFYGNRTYYLVPVVYEGEILYAFGLVSSRKLDDKTLEAIRNAVRMFSVKASCIINTRVVETLVNTIKKLKCEKIRPFCDKTINPLSGTLLILDEIDKRLNEGELDPELLDSLLLKIYATLDKLVEKACEIKSLEDKLVEKVEDIKKIVE